jgi:hypothetical protein
LRKKGEEREGEGFMYTLKSEAFPSFFIILLGSIDALTTVIGVLYFGAAELNPFMTGIIGTNIMAFLAIKISATFLIAFTYILAKRTLNKAMDKSTKSFRNSSMIMKGAYAGVVIFLLITVINNFTVLLA